MQNHFSLLEIIGMRPEFPVGSSSKDTVRSASHKDRLTLQQWWKTEKRRQQIYHFPINVKSNNLSGMLCGSQNAASPSFSIWPGIELTGVGRQHIHMHMIKHQ